MALGTLAAWNGRTVTITGTDVFYNGSEGDDLLSGTPADDRLGGLGGNDTIYGGAGNDVLFGHEAVFSADFPATDGNDELHGGDGDDALRGNNGDDRLYGDAGNDALRGDAGNDRLDGGAGLDLAAYRFDTQSLSAGILLDASATGSAAPLTLSDGLGGLDSLVGIEAVLVIGADFGDTLIGGSGGDRLTGLGGNDSLTGNAGADFLDGTDGDDTLDGGAQPAGGFDVATYGGAPDGVVVSLGDGTATGHGSDMLIGIEGVSGSAYADLLTGGTAAIDQWFEGGDSGDTIHGGGGFDTASWVGASGAVTVSLINQRATGAAGTDSLTGIEALEGSAWNDYLAGDGAGNRIEGGAGADTLRGYGGADTLGGGAGADQLAGGDGDDLYRVDADDTVVEGTGAGSGRDTVASAVSWVLGTGLENLQLAGTAAVNGTGNALANRLAGNGAANTLRGEAGNDVLEGGRGNDLLLGGAGGDTLTGGAGFDRFRFDTAPSGGRDRITDFVVADDTVQLDDAAFAGIGATGVLGGARFRAGSRALDATDRVIYDSSTGTIAFDADGSGAGQALVFAVVTPGTQLTSADFVIV